MLRQLLLLAVVAGLAGLFARNAPTFAGPAPDRVVDVNFPACIPALPTYTSIKDAVQAASPGDKIFVCAGQYTESTIEIDTGPLTILGPGTTPADDGVATVKVSPLLTGDAQFHIAANSVTVRGLDIDGTLPQNFVGTPYGFYITGSYGEISDNTLHDISYPAIGAYNSPAPIDVTIQRNQVSGGYGGINCVCDSSYVLQNVVGPKSSFIGIHVAGSTTRFRAIRSPATRSRRLQTAAWWTPTSSMATAVFKHRFAPPATQLPSRTIF